jgi:hypothetical protein
MVNMTKNELPPPMYSNVKPSHQGFQAHPLLKVADSSPVVVDLVHLPATETKASCLQHKKYQNVEPITEEHRKIANERINANTLPMGLFSGCLSYFIW